MVRSDGGRLFQTSGPQTANARRPQTPLLFIKFEFDTSLPTLT